MIAATVDFQTRMREAYRTLSSSSADREARARKAEELRQQYSKAIADIIPPSEAEKIVTGLWRKPLGPEAFGPVSHPQGSGEKPVTDQPPR